MPVKHSIVSVYPPAPSGDITPPGAVTDLSVADVTFPNFTLTVGTTPGDNGFTGANAASYRIAWALSPITTEAQWLAANYVAGWTANTAAAGAAQSLMLTIPTDPGPPPALLMDFWVAIRFQDAAGNVGGISNSVEVVV